MEAYTVSYNEHHTQDFSCTIRKRSTAIMEQLISQWSRIIYFISSRIAAEIPARNNYFKLLHLIKCINNNNNNLYYKKSRVSPSVCLYDRYTLNKIAKKSIRKRE